MDDNFLRKISSVNSKTPDLVVAKTNYSKESFISYKGQSYKVLENIKKGTSLLLLNGVAIPSKIENQSNVISSRVTLNRKTVKSERKKNLQNFFSYFYMYC